MLTFKRILLFRRRRLIARSWQRYYDRVSLASCDFVVAVLVEQLTTSGRSCPAATKKERIVI